MTGWRIGEPLSLRRKHLDLDAGTAFLRHADNKAMRHADNKAKRDELVRLHPVLIDHLPTIACFEPMVFTWNHHNTTLWCEFERIQQAAGIHLDYREDHQHTPGGHVYGFHDLRRAFATVNAESLTADAL